MPTTLYIKHMVCPRCVKVVRDELTALGLDVRSVELGEVVVAGNEVPAEAIRRVLEKNGFELVEDKRAKVIEDIKHAVLKLARNDHEKNPIRIKDSEFIAREVGRDYHTLSSLFSTVENITIERYLILQRIEYAKELLKYGDRTLSEISYLLGYSSVQHLSNQFKSVTGMTPTQFRSMGPQHRHSIDRLVHRHG